MASAALDSKLHRTLRFYEATNGKKTVMALTGAALWGFVIIHLLGNLQVFLGPGKLDQYGQALRSTGGLLWVARGGLLLCAVLHITAALQLMALKSKARPQPYVKKVPTTSSFASRTMYLSGPVILGFIIYHLMHFTLGVPGVHPDFVEGAVHANLVKGLSQPFAAVLYLAAMSMLLFHLYHGIWSMFQTVGLSHPRYTPLLKKAAAGIAIALAGGNIAIVVSVLLGIVK